MTKKLEDLPLEEQARVRELIHKGAPTAELRARRDALHDSLLAKIDEGVRDGLIRSALNGATEWLRFIDREHGRELSELELRGVRSKLVECEAALRQATE